MVTKVNNASSDMNIFKKSSITPFICFLCDQQRAHMRPLFFVQRDKYYFAKLSSQTVIPWVFSSISPAKISAICSLDSVLPNICACMMM